MTSETLNALSYSLSLENQRLRFHALLSVVLLKCVFILKQSRSSPCPDFAPGRPSPFEGAGKIPQRASKGEVAPLHR